MTECGICKRPLDTSGDPLSLNCGGDCWGCIGEIEASGYAPSLLRVVAEHFEGLRPEWKPSAEALQTLREVADEK